MSPRRRGSSTAPLQTLVHELVAAGALPTTHCTDDGVGIVYRGTKLVEAVSEHRGSTVPRRCQVIGLFEFS